MGTAAERHPGQAIPYSILPAGRQPLVDRLQETDGVCSQGNRRRSEALPGLSQPSPPPGVTADEEDPEAEYRSPDQEPLNGVREMGPVVEWRRIDPDR